ncbi:M15 family metallopeptidase [Frischella sp. Ac48]|uniref:M15 family metallopeptidase n=1 Tax=Frischella sp. Ac48 TaxID=2804531 RepID=UPI001C7DA385|nr:M15 family metallopeptidase [Frischella sp. Ac48]MBX4134168.1 M15 family metallopeptidase [Frischella sp. Ac48]
MKKILFFLLLNLTFTTMAETIPLNKLIGQFNEKTDPNFVALDSTILPVNKPGMYLQKEVADQLTKAYQDFKIAHPNIPFIVVSATRNYAYQNSIWQNKWDRLFKKLKNEPKTAQEILKYSSMPGTSRHHWGTDVDITSVSSDYFTQDPKGKILFQWLQTNMSKYGFCQSFNHGRKGGYQPEEWHWSYQPIAKKFLAQYKNILASNEKSIINQLTFAGYNKIKLRDLIEEYVFDVNPDCY